ncbi:hypothetical protein CD351_05692 [Erythrobacter sp. KY5]|uniref:hypothetical protein n=1 Tax=Erythrobacter sp. KY5 TaxID=2011159 RepID=UPI000DBF01E4|nr:hypothetical protein [Erythrobacter sp. KY5]AWW75862.1 hypothetical protein CD351_05692 [Erythrobacter sp. KY5]
MKVYFATLCMLSIVGCTTIQTNYVPETRQISFPQIGSEQTASIGEEMVKQGTATTTNGAVTNRENNIRGVVLSPGFYPQIGEDENYIYTTFGGAGSPSEFGRVITTGNLFGSNVLPQSIRFAKNKQETCAVGPSTYGITSANCDSEFSYRFEKRPIVSANNFQQTLIYSGRVGNRIRISYREFSGSTARPAFSNEAEYDLSESEFIAYRGARLRVLNANNESITYVVESNFNTQ